MAVTERLTLGEAAGQTLVATEHVHRYELAAELCAGLRVVDIGCGVGYGSRILRDVCPEVTGIDYDTGAIESAKRAFGDVDGLEYVVAEGTEFLRERLRERFDAIVMFESLEHLPNVEKALESLRRHADAELRLVVSVPNSRAFEEENPYHRTDFGFEEAHAVFEDFPDVTMLYQFLSEGSLITNSNDGSVAPRLVFPERVEQEYANHFIACVNFGSGSAAVAQRIRLELAASPTVSRHMMNLERANRELWEANVRLARGQVGKFDSAAASLLGQLETARRQLQELQDRIAAEEAEDAHEEWIRHLHEQIETQRQIIDRIEASPTWRLAGRYWRARQRVTSWFRRS